MHSNLKCKVSAACTVQVQYIYVPNLESGFQVGSWISLTYCVLYLHLKVAEPAGRSCMTGHLALLGNGTRSPLSPGLLE